MGASGPLPKPDNILVHLSKTQPTLGSFIDPSTLRLFILQWIICNHIPFRKIESPYLHQFLAYLNPSVDKLLPSHQTIHNWILKDFQVNKAQLCSLLSTVSQYIHITFDL